MKFKFVTALLATLVLAACANQMEPAQKALAEVESALQAVSADASKYIPDQLGPVQQRLTELKAAFDKKDYKAVLAGAPALLTDAKALADSAAAKKTEFTNQLNADWTSMSGSLPQAVAAIESRLGILSKSRKLPDGITKDTLATAQAGLDEAKSNWTAATAAFGAGNVEEAVAKASSVKARAEEIMSALGMQAGG
jgi:muramoyltetrapeptide carboxypeptidase LdcA involved in peptidoglycan recycling